MGAIDSLPVLPLRKPRLRLVMKGSAGLHCNSHTTGLTTECLSLRVAIKVCI